MEFALQGEGFRMEVQPHAGYLRAYVHDGHDSLAVSTAMWRMAREQCVHFGARRLLLVENLEGGIAPDEFAPLVQAMCEMGFRGMRIAFVELREEPQDNEHGEILALEEGIDVMVFTNEDHARRWLLYGEGDVWAR